MVTKDKILEIVELYNHTELYVTEISKRVGVSRPTVYKYVNEAKKGRLSNLLETSQATDEENSAQESLEKPSILNPYIEVISKWLVDDQRESRKQRHTCKRIHDRLCKEYGFTGSLSIVEKTVPKIKASLGIDGKRGEDSFFIPLSHEAGEAQADFGRSRFLEKGESHNGSHFVMSFPQSNMRYCVEKYGENLECVLESLQAIFEHLNGVPPQIWFDNASSIVHFVIQSDDREINERFRAFAAHYGFKPVFMRPGKGNEKGSVEAAVSYLRHNLLVPVPEFDSMGKFNKELLVKAEDLIFEEEHYKQGVKIGKLFEADKKRLLPLPSIPFDTSRTLTVRTNKCGLFKLNKGLHWYSSAPNFCQCDLAVTLTSSTVTVKDLKGNLIVVHPRLYGREDERMQRIDYVPYLKYIARKPRSFLNTPLKEMMPEDLATYLVNLPNSERGEFLKSLAEATETEGFEKAVQDAAEKMRSEYTFRDSLPGSATVGTTAPAPVTTENKPGKTDAANKPAKTDAFSMDIINIGLESYGGFLDELLKGDT